MGPVFFRLRQIAVAALTANALRPVPGFRAGVLAFGYDGRLDQADVVFLEAAAGHIAQALARVRLSEALARRATEAAEAGSTKTASLRASSR